MTTPDDTPRWLGYSHAEILAMVQAGPGRAAGQYAQGNWHATWFSISYVEANLSRAIADIGSGWEGEGAAATAAAVTPLGRWALDGAEQALSTSKTLDAQAEYADYTRLNMPPEPYPGLIQNPPDYTPPDMMDNWRTEDVVRDQEAARAQELMQTYTYNSYDTLPGMLEPTPPPTVAVNVAALGTGGGTPGPGVGGGGGVSSGLGPSSIEAALSPSPAPGGAVPAGATPPPGPGSGGVPAGPVPVGPPAVVCGGGRSPNPADAAPGTGPGGPGNRPGPTGSIPGPSGSPPPPDRLDPWPSRLGPRPGRLPTRPIRLRTRYGGVRPRRSRFCARSGRIRSAGPSGSGRFGAEHRRRARVPGPSTERLRTRPGSGRHPARPRSAGSHPDGRGPDHRDPPAPVRPGFPRHHRPDPTRRGEMAHARDPAERTVGVLATTRQQPGR